MLTCRIVSDPGELAHLAPRWRDLNAGSVRPEAMSSPEWLLTWQRHYGANQQFVVGVYESGEQLVGLAPLCRRTFRYRLGLSFRRLEWMGAESDAGDGVCSDHMHLLVRPGFEDAVCDAFVSNVVANDFGGWDEAVFAAVDADHPLTAIFQDAWARRGYTLRTTPVSQSPYLALPPSWDEYTATLSKKRRQSLKYAERDFLIWADGTQQHHRATDAVTLAEGKNALVSLHGERWSASGGVFSSSRFSGFHDDFMNQMLAAKMLDLSWITVFGKPVAAQYSFRFGDRLLLYQMGRRVDVPHQVRLGIVLLIETMKRAIGDGVKEFDFLSGESQYKSLFTTTNRAIVDLRIARPSAVETLRRSLVWVKHRFASRRERP